MITISERKASIEHFDSLVSVSETVMIFLLSKKQLRIFGNNLRITLYTKDEVWIEGEIRQVIIDEH